MAETKKIILTVRATKDGVYDNYLWKGPIESDQGFTPGEVFKVNATPYIVKDERGNPVFELDEDGKKLPLIDKAGKHLKDEKGKLIFKVKMASFFSHEWMERVEDDTELTHPDRPEWKIPEAYRIKKTKPVRTVALPADLMTTEALAIPAAVTDAISKEAETEVADVI